MSFFTPRGTRPEEGVTQKDANAILGTPALGDLVEHLRKCSTFNKSAPVQEGLELLTKASNAIGRTIAPVADNVKGLENTVPADEVNHTTYPSPRL